MGFSYYNIEPKACLRDKKRTDLLDVFHHELHFLEPILARVIQVELQEHMYHRFPYYCK